MMIEEMRRRLKDKCDSYGSCSCHNDNGYCPLFDYDTGSHGGCVADCRDEFIEEHYRIMFPEEFTEEESPTEPTNNVDHPNHYNQEGAMECIDEMILLFGVEAVKHFCLCNAWKYRYRANAKNGEEDLNKANWYINKYKELTEYGIQV